LNPKEIKPCFVWSEEIKSCWVWSQEYESESFNDGEWQRGLILGLMPGGYKILIGQQIKEYYSRLTPISIGEGKPNGILSSSLV